MTLSDDIIYGRQALKLGEPWIVPGARKWVEDHIETDDSVFEWGAGGSTLWFARLGCDLVSIEHNIKWYKWVTYQLLEQELYYMTHVWYIQGEPDKGKDKFRCYADTINHWPDEYFNLIFVDGEASCRGWCITNAIPKLKPGGILLIDNSDWLRREFPGWERIDFVERGLKWIGQPGTFDWWTSVVIKPESGNENL